MFLLNVLPDLFAIYRLNAQEPFPTWAMDGDFFSVTRTSEELSVICPQSLVPEGVLADTNWRALKVKGPLDFALVGVLAELAGLLAAAKVSIFVISTFDTDYILVKEEKLKRAVEALVIAGHQVSKVTAPRKDFTHG